MRFILRTLPILLFFFAQASLAAEDTHTFANSQQLERFQHFTKNLRCPMCDNQNLEGSNSAISADLRDELARMISDGKTDQQINEFMRARYGDFIFYKPPLDSNTLWLWLVPLGLGVIAVLVLLRLARSKARLTENSVSADDRARAQRLLAQQDTE